MTQDRESNDHAAGRRPDDEELEDRREGHNPKTCKDSSQHSVSNHIADDFRARRHPDLGMQSYAASCLIAMKTASSAMQEHILCAVMMKRTTSECA